MDITSDRSAGTPAAGIAPHDRDATGRSSVPGAGRDGGEQKAFAWTMVGFFVGATQLCGCAATVTYLPAWGNRIGLPWVFLGFTAIMLIAGQLAVAGGQALWNALRDSE